MGQFRISEDILKLARDTLLFYQNLGFERLPLNLSGLQTFGQVKGQGINKEVALRELRKEIGDCRRCKLSKQRKNIVFGEGSPETSIMFIGEAPGSEEDIQGRPFVGEAGQLLTRLINKMGFKREDVYIANIVKCRPPFNRDPEEDEIVTCFPFLKRQIEIVRPRIIVSLGRISARTILNTKIPITKLRGRFYEYEDIPVMPTFHPAYLLRNPKDKWLVWSDMQQVLHRLGLGEEK
ncbi:MAG: uracil-DNA glycosylase [Thermodesulfovibrionales bacterium]